MPFFSFHSVYSFFSFFVFTLLILLLLVLLLLLLLVLVVLFDAHMYERGGREGQVPPHSTHPTLFHFLNLRPPSAPTHLLLIYLTYTHKIERPQPPLLKQSCSFVSLPVVVRRHRPMAHHFVLFLYFSLHSSSISPPLFLFFSLSFPCHLPLLLLRSIHPSLQPVTPPSLPPSLSLLYTTPPSPSSPPPPP